MTNNHCSSQEVTCHGVFIDVYNTGVLLTGVSGIGKSELALGLIDRGHCLIADDIVICKKMPDGRIIGHCPELLQDFLEVRGLGILNIRAMFGDSAVREQKILQLIVNIISISREELHTIDRLNGMHRQQTIFDVDIPEVSIPVAAGRSLSILVEAAVRNQVLKSNGYEAGVAFRHRQRTLLGAEKQDRDGDNSS